VLGALEHGYWWLAAVIVGSSLIALAYVWRFVEAAYFQPAGPDAPRRGETPLTMLVPAWLMVAACIYFGLETSFNVGYASGAVELLLRGTP
jgi:multicomponent Na+:H+ antiporter subunit D